MLDSVETAMVTFAMMAEQLFGGWEIVLILAVLLIIFGAAKGFGLSIREFDKAAKEVAEEIEETLGPNEKHSGVVYEALTTANTTAEFTYPQRFDFQFTRMLKSMILFIAQGFGSGRISIAPGTFGSLAGLVWFALLLATRRIEFYALGALLAIALSVWLCGAAEKILKQKDPSSIVLDEIVAMPVCFACWVGDLYFGHGQLPTPEYFLSSHIWPWTLGVFAAFRFFDVVKPWPIRQSQSLPGGWGVTVDDLLAAVYVNLVSLVVLALL